MREQVTADHNDFLARPPRWVWMPLAAIIAVLYLASVNAQWWPTPDSALYLGLAKSIAQGDGYQFNGQTDNTVTPGLPLILAALRLISGDEPWFAANLLMTICGLAAGLMFYLSLSRLSAPWPAFLAAIATLGGYLFFWYSHLILTDVPFMALAYLTLWMGLKYLSTGKHWWPIVVVMVLALCIRAPAAVLLGPMAMGLALEKCVPLRRRLVLAGVMAATILIVDGAWFAIAKTISSDVPYQISTMDNLSRLAQDQWQRFAISLDQLWRNLGKIFAGSGAAAYPGIVAAVLAIIGGALMWRKGHPVVAVTAGGYMLIMMATRRADMPDRYVLFIAPLLILMVLEAAGALAGGVCGMVRRVLARRRNDKPSAAAKPQVAARLAASLLVTMLIVAGNIKPMRQYVQWEIVASRQADFHAQIDRWLIGELFDIAAEIKDQPPDSVVLIEAYKARMVHYLSGRRVIEMPDGKNATAPQADEVVAFCVRRPQARVLVLRRGTSEFNDRLHELLANQPHLTRIYDGPYHMIYRRD